MTSDDEDVCDESDNGIYINIAVPPNAEPGVDSLSFEYQGTPLEILVPEGSVAGDILRIQVGTLPFDESENEEEGGGEEGNEDGGLLGALGGLKDYDGIDTSSKADANPSDGISVVPLGSGLKPDLYQNANISKIGSHKSLSLVEHLPSSCKTSEEEGDGTHSMVWPSGRVLSQFLSSSTGVHFLEQKLIEKKSITQYNCMELGSGLGVCGLALAHALASCCTSESLIVDRDGMEINVVLADQGQAAKKLLEENIQRNLPPPITSCSSSTVNLSAKAFCWGDSLEFKNVDDNKFHLVIGSDLLYNSQESYDPLLQTIQTGLHEDGTIILACRWRKPIFERKFFKKAERMGIEFELCKDFLSDKEFFERCPCLLGWSDYGNPAREASNKFFHETSVSIDSSNFRKKKIAQNICTKKSLAEVSEDDTKRMSTKEYTIYEELQVQIHVGRFSSNEMKDESKSRKRSRVEVQHRDKKFDYNFE